LSRPGMHLPWVEKYRPRKLDEIINQDEVVAALKSIVQTKNVPHMLFTGPPGTGKTATAHAFAQDLFGPRYIDDGLFVEINASVTRDTPVVIREGGIIKRTIIGELVNKYFNSDQEGYVILENGPEILSIDCVFNVAFKPISGVSRHRVSKIVRIRYEGGEVKTSLDHSVMVFDPSTGGICPKLASELQVGDLLISFKETLMHGFNTIDISSYAPSTALSINDRIIHNAAVKKVSDTIEVDEDYSWIMGPYMAEGCVGDGGTSSRTIFSLGIPQDTPLDHRLESTSARLVGSKPYTQKGFHGFDRSRDSPLSMPIHSTQLSKFFTDIYHCKELKRAVKKLVPEIVYNLSPNNRSSFIKGYVGDSSGKWGEVVSYLSTSNQALVDVAWLARITGLEGPVFNGECRIIGKCSRSSYAKSDLLPAALLKPLIEFVDDSDTRRLLRHQMFGKRRGRVSKWVVKEVLERIDEEELDERNRAIYENLKRLTASPLYAVKVTGITVEDYDGFVYDVSVPGSEAFWGGTAPVLLHNSDERGIETIRERVKAYARAVPFGGFGFRILLLDESDQLTDAAQHAFRRTMEQFSATCRFILAANYSNRIIEPIQSRCAVLRFKPLSPDSVRNMLERIAKAEGLELEEEAVKAIYDFALGDMRKAINILQSAASLSKKVDEKTIYDVMGVVSKGEIRRMIKLALDGKFTEARNLLRDLIYLRGHQPQEITASLAREIPSLDISEDDKLRLIEYLGEVDYRLAEGGTPEVQLQAFLAKLVLLEKA